MVVRVGRMIAFLFTSWLGADVSKISLDRILFTVFKKKVALCVKICKCQAHGMLGAQPNLLWLALK